MFVPNAIGSQRRRVFAMLAALVCLLSLGSVLGKSSRAEAAVARPTLQASAVKSGVVTLSGRAPDAVRVALQRRKGTEWVTVRYLNAPSHVRSGRATLRGYIPRANARVGLQRRKGTSWVRVRYLTVRQHAVTTSLPVAPQDVVPAGNDDPTLRRPSWSPQHNYSPGNTANWSCHQDSPENVSVGSGMLSLTLRKGAQQTCGAYRSGETTPYTSGQVSTYGRFSQAYGRFEARIRNTKTSEPGLHEAFWMWPDVRYGSADNWSSTGEIDITETYPAASNRGLPYLHYTANDNGGPSTVGPNANTSHSCYASRGVFNTWALTWSPTKIQVSVNGTCASPTPQGTRPSTSGTSCS